MKNQTGSTRFVRGDLYVLPTNPTTPTSLQGFQRRFFCGKARGIMLGRHRAPAVAICALGWSEHTFAKAWRALQHFANACNFDNVYANANDHKRGRTNRIGLLLALA